MKDSARKSEDTNSRDRSRKEHPMNLEQSVVLMKHPAVYPYLITRVVATMYHIIVLPKGEQNRLVEIARTQVFFNRLETCLALGPREALFVYPDGSETRCSDVPVGGVLVHDRLRPCKTFPEDPEMIARKDLLKKHIDSQRQGGYLFGDLTKGGRKPTHLEAGTLRGTQVNGVPKGLVLCPRCGEWRGSCIDLVHGIVEVVVQVHCICQNDNLCAYCGAPLYERKLNSNQYDTRDGKIWHVPGFSAFGHICGHPALVEVEQ